MAEDNQLRFDSHTALVVVDVQNDFADPKGSLYIPGGEQVAGVINELVEEARQADAFVVYTQDWHPEHTPHFIEEGGSWPKHCVRNTWGAELVSRLSIAGPVLKKGTGGEDGYSGFSVRDPQSGIATKTALDSMLEERGIERVIVVGLAHDVCVKETALDALRLGYETLVATPATRPVSEDGARRATRELRAAGAIVV